MRAIITSNLRPSERLVLLLIEGGDETTTQIELANRTGLGLRTVGATIRRLEKLGWLRVQRDPMRPSRYTVTPPAVAA